MDDSKPVPVDINSLQNVGTQVPDYVKKTVKLSP
jgi:hypothetical protein